MFDINFYMKAHRLQKKIDRGQGLSRKDVGEELESLRNKKPFVYNIETTNACNMKCKMCPRTTMMTRKIETIDKETFRRVADPIEPFTEDQWNSWKSFIKEEYGIGEHDMSENHFFLYIIPKIIQLHGYGDPLLDKFMPEYVKILTQKGVPTYFSCNPSNINVRKMEKMFENGLTYVKYSIETVDDIRHKQIRGKASDFTESYRKIVRLIELKEDRGYKTTIIITMLDLNSTGQKEEYELLKQAFKGLDVYIYLKSEDQQWYRKDFHGTCSIHWSEFCKHPWMSMTIKSNGEAAMCMEDFNNEIILGNARRQSLYEIWNGEPYSQFRRDHLVVRKGIKCTEQCDMKLVGNYLVN